MQSTEWHITIILINEHNTQKSNKKREKNCHEDISFEFSRTLMTQSLISAEDPLTKHDEESVHRRPKNRDKKREQYTKTWAKQLSIPILNWLWQTVRECCWGVDIVDWCSQNTRRPTNRDMEELDTSTATHLLSRTSANYKRWQTVRECWWVVDYSVHKIQGNLQTEIWKSLTRAYIVTHLLSPISATEETRDRNSTMRECWWGVDVVDLNYTHV